MNKEYKKEVENLLIGAKIEDITFVRGYGLVPARFSIFVQKEEKKYIIEAETNFRAISKGENILSFNDMYLDKKGKELSVRAYRKQKDIEKSYLFDALNNVNRLFSNRKIYSCTLAEYGDLNIRVKNVGMLQVINDSHADEEVVSVFRILDCQDVVERVFKDGIVFHHISVLYEVLMENNKLELKKFHSDKREIR